MLFLSIGSQAMTIGSATVLQVENPTAHIGDVFTVDITCIPSEPVKAWELKIRYDNETLQLLNITEGDFFGDYQTFFIMNITLDLAYALVVGKGNVSAQGVVCTMVFEAMGVGNTTLGLYDAGVCNETQYLELTTQDGSVRVLVNESDLSFAQRRFADGLNTMEGWNTFRSGVWSYMEGWASFKNNIPTIQGYSTFTALDKEKDDYTVVSALAIIILIAAMIIVFLKR